jgi:regulator of sigma E protease
MIFIHELGHFLVARWCGVKVEKFSIGFGKAIAEWESKGVQWRLGWIPLGGYVKMKGEVLDDPRKEEVDSFPRQVWWKKVLIGLSGPFANLILGLLLFIVSFLLPVHIQDQLPVINRAEGKWSEMFAPGDSIVSVGAEHVIGFSDFLEKLMERDSSQVEINRAGQKQSIMLSSADVESLAVSLYPVADTRIGEVVPKTPAYHAKLQSGDRIVAVDSIAVSDWYQMRELIINSNRNKVSLSIERNGAVFDKQLELETSLNTGGNKAIGIMQYQPVRYQRHFAVGEALKLGAFNSLNFVRLNYQMLGKLVQKPAELKKSVGGPVMIASMSQQMGRKGFSTLLLFFGSISLMLMIMNLLPIPILDGGLILFAIVEGIIRRPIPVKVQSVLQSIGFMLLMGLMVLAFYSDIASEVLRFMSR